MPSIRDVADAAGVSTTTVSRALNGKDGMRPSTRRKVSEAARQLGYVPSALARALVSGRSATVGLSLPDLDLDDDGTTATIVLAAARRAFERHYALALVPALRDNPDPSRFPLDGLVVVGQVVDQPLLAALEALGIPHATIQPESGGLIERVRASVDEALDRTRRRRADY